MTTRTKKPARPGCCRCCNRALKDPVSVERGLGPVCVHNPECNPRDEGGAALAEALPSIDMDPLVVGLICKRGRLGQALTNVPQRHVEHSPTGFEWGYGGSGPADLALNVLALFVGPPAAPGPMPGEYAPPAVWQAWQDAVDQAVSCHDGTVLHATAYDLHQDFKWEFVATMPFEGGRVPARVIRDWIAAKAPGLPVREAA